MDKFFSIAIPTYEMCGFGVEFLENSFSKLHAQSFKDFEVLVSDHSLNDDISDLCGRWMEVLDIKYFKNDYKRGSSSANLNNAITKSQGRWIKILFQDDFLYECDSLEIIKSYIDINNPDWIATACEHTFDGFGMYRPFYPKWNKDIEFGNNTISSPSVICIKNKDLIYFDERFVWLMDVEYYKRMYNRYGEPSYIYDINVVNRTWIGSISSQIDLSIKNKELEIIKDRHMIAIEPELHFDKFVNLQFDRDILYSRGIVDINEHLPTLRKYASLCEHVTEMGTRFAVSILALLIANPKKVVSIDLNYHFYEKFENETKEFAEKCGTDFDFVIADVLKTDIEKTDMLFIDTLHTYNQLSKELRRHESNVNKWIVLHDTVTYGQTDEIFYSNGLISDEVSNDIVVKTGLYTALSDFLEENKNWKIKEHYVNNNGLTVIERC
jgi:hypothetical protein